MLKLANRRLSSLAKAQLASWQHTVDSYSSFADRVAAARRLFGAHNRIGNATFDEAKRHLRAMCSGAQRCAYCEDSVADEVEHFLPKKHHPEAAFRWANYLYACGPCNGPKNDKFAVINLGIPGFLQHYEQRPSVPTPPPPGQPALINPRSEDPLTYLFLDLQGTFAFVPKSGLSARDQSRAEYTIRVLRLNDREYLLAARRCAFSGYRSRLADYVSKKSGGAMSRVEVARYRREIQCAHHHTVWKEMQRQCTIFPVLHRLFSAAPECLNW